MADFLFGEGSEDNGVGAGSDNGGLVFDLTDTKEDSGFEVLPKGDYPAIVDEVTFGESKSGNAMLTVKYKITEGEHENRVIFDYWVLQGNGAEFGLGKLKKFLSRICPEMDLSNFNPETFAEEGEAVNRELVLVLSVSKQTKGEYKGELRNNVKDIKPATDGSFL